MIKRDGFVFYKSFYDAVKELDPEIRLNFYEALFEYALEGQEPDIQGIEKAFFLFVKPQIDANNKRYENGKSGGRKPNRNQTETKLKPNGNQTETKPKPNGNQNITKLEPKEKEKEKEKDKDKDKDKGKEKEKALGSSNDSPPPRRDFEKFKSFYNRAMQDVMIGGIENITDRRKEKLNEVLSKYSDQDVKLVLEKCRKSKFLNGANERDWLASFDWIFSINNFTKILEGNYDNKASERIALNLNREEKAR